jgi:hypothetical protein
VIRLGINKAVDTHIWQLIYPAHGYFYSGWQTGVRCKSEGKNIVQYLFVLGSSRFVVFRETVRSTAVDTACLLKGKMVTFVSFVSYLCEAKHNMQEIFS